MARVLGELDGKSDRRARFVCALALAWPDRHCDVFVGTVEGAIAREKRGLRGFGYDPIFVPEGETETFGEMDPVKKHGMSHRAVAFAKLKAHLAP
jgi:XTP/dITP diphosphohydrolase